MMLLGKDANQMPNKVRALRVGEEASAGHRRSRAGSGLRGASLPSEVVRHTDAVVCRDG